MGGDKMMAPEYTACAARQHSPPTKGSRIVTGAKRKRPDNGDVQSTRNLKKIKVPTTTLQAVDKSGEAQIMLSPLPTPPQQEKDAFPLSVLAQEEKNTNPAMVPAVNPDSPSTHKPMTEAENQAIQQIISTQIGLEILIKHKELRLIDQELAKCQIALEQLRRCSEVPFPITKMSEDVRNGTGSAVRRPGLRSLSESPAPWGVTDGPYTRHYARWLLPDPRFDGGDVESSVVFPAGKYPSKTRSTRGSFTEIGHPDSKARKLQISTASKTRAGTTQPQDKSAPMVLKRKSDGVMVKLVCLDCGRHNFGSPQGFINHCRIGHGRSFTSHDAAAEACGEPVELDEAGALVGHEPVSTPTTGMVHPLIRSARMLPAPFHNLLAASKNAPNNKQLDDLKSSAADTKPSQQNPIQRLPAKSLDFQPSSITPHLSALVHNRGLGLNLETLVADAQTKADLDDSDSDEEDVEIDTPMSETARGRHPQVAGTKHPARSHMSPLPSPSLSRKSLATSPGPNTTLIANDPGMGTLPVGGPPSHLQFRPSPGNIFGEGTRIEPSPTNESHQAPSLVDDDDDEAHSPPTSLMSGDETGSVDFQIEGEEADSQSALSVPNLHGEYKQPPNSAAPVTSPRPSAIRSRLGSREEKHVSFAHPGPSRDVKNTKGASDRRRKRG